MRELLRSIGVVPVGCFFFCAKEACFAPQHVFHRFFLEKNVLYKRLVQPILACSQSCGTYETKLGSPAAQNVLHFRN